MPLYYRPLLPNGKEAPLSWRIKAFFLNVPWPLSDKASRRGVIFSKFMLIASFSMYMFTNEAEIHYVIASRHDIGEMLNTLATYLILVETHLRIFHMAFNNQHFKELIKQFYLKIYIESATAPDVFRKIERNLFPTMFCSNAYILTLFTYLAIPINGYFHDERLLPFKMTFHYDFTPLPIYIPTFIIMLYIGVAVISELVGESNTLAMFILHLNAQYSLLQLDLLALNSNSNSKPFNIRMDSDRAPETAEAPGTRALREYRRKLIAIIRRNAELNDFAMQLQKQYSFRIFVMMALSAILLCVLSFKVVTLGASSENSTYISWISSKIVELLVFGELGSTLIHTTDKMSTTYYLSNWEDVILNSPNARDNVEIMQLIKLAINLNRRPFYLSGLNFFTVSLETVISILQGAGSYFTCIYAFY